jgi:acrylyl-CoA reductase (NADPH)
MDDGFSAWRLHAPEEGASAPAARLEELEDAHLPAGEVTVRVAWTGLNYKDGLAVTGRGRVVRGFPRTPGVDFTGVVERSTHEDFSPGDHVTVNGWGVGEHHDGGWASRARVPAAWVTPVHGPLTLRGTAAMGTAGYTAALCVMALARHGVAPGGGPVLVTGASGGVGSVAVALLAALGHEVAALTGRPDTEGPRLRDLGAAEVVARADFDGPAKPLESERWAGVIDVAGGSVLAKAIAQTRYGGVVAATGLAGAATLETSVMPFILRGVLLAGVDSVQAPQALRAEAWALLARRIDFARFEASTREVDFDDLPACAHELIAGRIAGRVIARAP